MNKWKDRKKVFSPCALYKCTQVTVASEGLWNVSLGSKADRNRGRMRTRRAEVASGIVLVGMV